MRRLRLERFINLLPGFMGLGHAHEEIETGGLIRFFVLVLVWLRFRYPLIGTVHQGYICWVQEMRTRTEQYESNARRFPARHVTFLIIDVYYLSEENTAS